MTEAKVGDKIRIWVKSSNRHDIDFAHLWDGFETTCVEVTPSGPRLDGTNRPDGFTGNFYWRGDDHTGYEVIKSEVNDIFGRAIVPGVTVVYPNRHGSWMSLESGKVVRVVKNETTRWDYKTQARVPHVTYSLRVLKDNGRTVTVHRIDRVAVVK